MEGFAGKVDVSDPVCLGDAADILESGRVTTEVEGPPTAHKLLTTEPDKEGCTTETVTESYEPAADPPDLGSQSGAVQGDLEDNIVFSNFQSLTILPAPCRSPSASPRTSS